MERVLLKPLTSPSIDAGLRRHMVGIYRVMALGLLVTAAVALGVASSPALSAAIFGSPLKWLAMLAPLAFVMVFSFRIERMTTASARLAFYGFAALMGVSMASIFLVFTATSIAQVFLVAATMFAGISLWGYTTGRDLSRWSTFLMMGVIGVLPKAGKASRSSRASVRAAWPGLSEASRFLCQARAAASKVLPALVSAFAPGSFPAPALT